MLEAGLVDEVRSLLARLFSRTALLIRHRISARSSAICKGEISLEEAVSLIRRNTRTFVRRQANWFKASDPNIHWCQAGPEMERR